MKIGGSDNAKVLISICVNRCKYSLQCKEIFHCKEYLHNDFKYLMTAVT